MCPDWKSNWWPFGLQAGAQSTEPHQPGQFLISCSSSSPSGIPMIQMLERLKLSQRFLSLSSYFWILVFFCLYKMLFLPSIPNCWLKSPLPSLHCRFPVYFSFFLRYFYWLYYYNFPNSSPFIFPLPCPPNPSAPPPLVHVHGFTYKFFESSVSYTIFYLSPFILCLLIMLLLPCTFYPYSSLPPPHEIPPCDVHFSDFVPVLVVCLVFVFVVFLFF